MFGRPITFLFLAALFTSSAISFGQARQGAVVSANPAIPDVPTALASIPAQAALLKFSRGEVELPRGGHLQGIQVRFDPARKRHLVFLSHDSLAVAYLAIVEFPADLTAEGRVIHVHQLPSDGQSPPLRHAGGIQLAGDVLVAGLEDNQRKTRSEIQFWDMADPLKPAQLTHLTVRRSGVPKDMTAGAVGLVGRESDHLLAVANWDSRAIDFYRSNGRPLDDTNCRFEFHARWRADRADKNDWTPDATFAAYQAVNLIADSGGQLFAVGFGGDSPGKDAADLFALDLTRKPESMVRKIASKPMQLQAGCNFRAAAGAWIDNGRLAILASPHALGPQAILNIAGQPADR